MKLKLLYLSSFIVLSLMLACTQKSEMTPDKERNQFIDELIAKMTLEEKIGQLNLVASGNIITGQFSATDVGKKIKEGKVGSLLNTTSVEKIRDVQKVAVEESRLKIPLIFGLDVIHGYQTIFPIPLGLASSFDMDIIEKSAQIAALEASADGICWTFSPMVDITRDPRWGRVSEGAGEDTFLGSLIAEAMVRGYQGDDLSKNNTILACAKHFAAYGAAEAGRDYNTVDMSMLSLHEWYLPPYKACVDAGVGSLMTSFNEINGVPATADKWLLTDLLRKEWDFDGFVVTDYTSIVELIQHGVAADTSEAAALALNAGVNMDMQGRAYLNSLEKLLKEKKITMNQIDNAVRYVLEAKVKLGLFEDPYRYCDAERQEKESMTAENLQLARKFVAQSCVLLKNENQTLPIPKDITSIAIIGPLSDSKKDMLGNWSALGRWEQCVTLLEGIRNKVDAKIKVTYSLGCKVNDNDKSGFNDAIQLAKNADFIILALGENGWMSGEAACRANIDLPGVQNDLAEAIFKVGKPTTVVLFNGRPVAISKLNEMAPAILETWFGGTEAGNGIADVLFGDYNPSGKLTMTFPRNVGQVPIYYNYKNTGRPYNPEIPDYKYVSKYLDSPNDPLYPFGYGLSYTNFSYSDLDALVSEDQINITVTVSNSGKFDGEEVVQLYVQDKVGTITRPVKELKGFQKVLINKGESKEISFTLTKDDLAFYHPNLTKYFEPGEFVIHVGTNSVETLSKSILYQ